MSKPFKLSTVLYGHSLDVRSVITTPDNSIITGSRDKTAKYWRPNVFNTGYTDSMTYKDQKNFVASVLYISPTSEYPDGLIVTGGHDNLILIYKPSEPFATFKIAEHKDAVCCLSNGLDPNTFLSGSWDHTAKAWLLSNLKQSSVTFSGHAAAIWSVIQLANSNVVTACADKTIGIWLNNGQRIKILTGHTDCVRGVEDFPEFNHFLSVANDASVKVWTYDGDLLDTLYGHSNYIYSIAKTKSDGGNSFVTSDEDRSVRYWQDGVNTQIIELPAQSVWTVACLNNGDIVTGSSDGVVRVFTQEEERYASPEALKSFEEEVNALKKQTCQEIGGYKVSDLPGKEALYDPGKKAGQMKMIREDGGVVAYTWVEDDENSHWEKVGDVLGANEKANEGKTLHEGKYYDFVFSVDVEDGKPPLKLPYNKGEDVYVAANKFLANHNLPAIYLDQVVDFIFKNSQANDGVALDNNYVDPFTGASRYTPATNNTTFGTAGANLDPFTGGSSYTTSANATQAKPSQKVAFPGNADPLTGSSSYTTLSSIEQYFPHKTYLRFDMGDPNVILKKLNEFNQKSGDRHDKIDENVIKNVVMLCNESCIDDTVINYLFKLLEWPSDIIFPVIDVVRMAVRDTVNNNLIASRDGGIILDILKNYIARSKVANNNIVSLRALCNLFVSSGGEDLVFNNRIDLLETITSITTENKNIQIAVATFLLNLTILCLNREDEVGLLLLASVISDILPNIIDPEAQFRALVGMGNLLGDMTQRKELKSKILENTKFVLNLQQLSRNSGSQLEMKRMKCASLVQIELLN